MSTVLSARGGQSGAPLHDRSLPSFAKHAGFCLETQHFPDAPNRPDFPSTVLRPCEVFRSSTVHRFRVAA